MFKIWDVQWASLQQVKLVDPGTKPQHVSVMCPTISMRTSWTSNGPKPSTPPDPGRDDLVRHGFLLDLGVQDIPARLGGGMLKIVERISLRTSTMGWTLSQSPRIVSDPTAARTPPFDELCWWSVQGIWSWSEYLWDSETHWSSFWSQLRWGFTGVIEFNEQSAQLGQNSSLKMTPWKNTWDDCYVCSLNKKLTCPKPTQFWY